MSERLVNVDRESPMLLPVDIRQWVRGDDEAAGADDLLLRDRADVLPTHRASDVPRPRGTVQRVLADGGYVNAEQIESGGSTVDLTIKAVLGLHQFLMRRLEVSS